MRKNWGGQWDNQSMAYLLDSGPTPLFRNAISKINHNRCVVLGAGSEVSLVSEYCNNIVALNISREQLQSLKKFSVDLILADAQRLPLKESCTDLIVCKSTLHHLTDLNESIQEIKRVTSSNSEVFLYEPNLLNFIAFLGRKLFPTNIHDPTEKPFNPFILRRVINDNFNVVNETDFFVFAHLFPIIQKKIELTKKSMVLKKPM